MANKRRPSVEQFRQFVQNHPKLRTEVRQGKYTWQALFEEWYLLGEGNKQWEKYQEGNTVKEEASNDEKSDLMGNLLNVFKGMDITQIQKYISNANQALGAIQGVISSFQGGEQSKSEEPKRENARPNPFQFRKD
ncbi:YlbD family protein [Bacillus sp. MUM 13]|uniref:YlbD family protein n=1 Tax=Bacillus sp. MUM 13 TaxID=1678001 RepID=UPI0008F5CEF0|nr:YlbD family protein [Bacillus sp. MUM 13]OIK15166.1 hypothetical protein BIV59_00065 [Bacillus sp. MUM 13]